MFLKNRNISSKIKRSKVTEYAALKIKSERINICTKFSNCRWMKMAKIDLPKRSGKRSKVREKSVKSQGILKTILSGNPVITLCDKYQSLMRYKFATA